MSTRTRFAILAHVSLALLLMTSSALAKVVGIDITSKSDFAGGKEFGPVGR